VDGDIGLALAWSYFPHSWSVQCGSMKTPIQVFESDIDFKRAIAKRLKYGTGRITDAEVRKAVRSYSGAQGVSNFRPTAAAAIYHTFLPRTGGTVWDMSSGFGRRLLGAIACNRVSRYVGTDPCSQTMTKPKVCKGEKKFSPFLYMWQRGVGSDDLGEKLNGIRYQALQRQY
jgi:hypothetical protein